MCSPKLTSSVLLSVLSSVLSVPQLSMFHVPQSSSALHKQVSGSFLATHILLLSWEHSVAWELRMFTQQLTLVRLGVWHRSLGLCDRDNELLGSMCQRMWTEYWRYRSRGIIINQQHVPLSSPSPNSYTSSINADNRPNSPFSDRNRPLR